MTHTLTQRAFLLITAVFSVIYCYSESEGAEFSIRPSIAVREEYDDNIFLTDNNRADDYITRILPSVTINYRAPLWDWTLDYRGNWWYYSKIGENNVSHSLNLSSQMNMIENFLYLDVSDTYSNIVLEPRSPSSEINFDINRTDTNTFYLSPYFRFPLSPASMLTAGYRYTNIWYQEDIGINRQVLTGFTDIEYKFSPKFNASLGVEYVLDRPDKTFPDNDQSSVFFKVSYRINPKTDFDGTAGNRWIDFPQGSNKDRPIYNAGLTHRFHETGQVELRAGSTFTTSPLFGVLERQTEQLAVSYGEAFSVNGTFFHRKDIYLETDRTDETVGVTSGIEYRPNLRLTFICSGRYEKNRFMPEDVERDRYVASGEVDYLLTSKATLTLSYNYTKEDAQININDYTNNIGAVQIRIAL